MFRVGAALMGLLPRSGVGEEVAHAVLPPPEELLEGNLEHNEALLARLAEDPFAEQLLECGWVFLTCCAS